MRSFFLLPCALLAASAAAAGPVRFSAMGCGPYKVPDEIAMRHHIAAENRAAKKSAFLVHLGDINTGALAKAGKPMHAIQAQTGHKSVGMVARYVRDASLFDDNAASGIGL